MTCTCTRNLNHPCREAGRLRRIRDRALTEFALDDSDDNHKAFDKADRALVNHWQASYKREGLL